MIKFTRLDNYRHNHDVIRKPGLPGTIADVFFNFTGAVIDGYENVQIGIVGRRSPCAGTEDPDLPGGNLQLDQFPEPGSYFKISCSHVSAPILLVVMIP